VAEADEGYRFANWTGGGGTITDVHDASTNITMSNSYSITANFELEEGWRSLTISSTEGGSVTEPGEGTFAYATNTTVDLVAQPNEYYEFVEWTGNVSTIDNVNAAITTITMDDNYSIMANFSITPMVAAGGYHTVGVKSDGTVVAVGWNELGQCKVSGWTDITQVATGRVHTVGLEADGTVVAVGWNELGQCKVSGWTDITQVATGRVHTVGLEADGTVVAVGNNYYDQCAIGGWTDTTQVSAGYRHTVGVKSDGTVVTVGDNNAGQCDVGSWTDIDQVAAGWSHTVGVKEDGTMVAAGLEVELAKWDLN